MQPIWLPQLNPATLIVTAAPEGFAARSLPDPATLSIRGEPSSDGLHGVVEDVQGDLGVWLPSGDTVVQAGVFLPFDEHFHWRRKNALRLYRHISGERSGPPPREERLTRFQLHRAALMLRVWDGVESGEPRRLIASILINEKVRTLRALDWKNAPERRRLSRILAAARERIEGGYLRWLAPRARHQRHNVDRKT